jgi:dienelactone hydrolase
VAWLIKEGIADPKRVGIMGGSYGGYATLAGLAFTPELYAVGVDIVGPSNIATLLASIPPYWAVIRKTFDVRLGDPDDPEDVARMRAQSPLFSANRIRAPLLVIQGANDPRVNKAEADQIVIALREQKLPVEYIVAPDEGHGFQGRVNRIAMFAAVEKFLAAHLGGRFQEEMPEEVAKRLQAITVDIGSVTYEAKPAGAAAAEPVRFSGDAVQPGELKYRQVVQMGERTLDATATVQVSEAVWDSQPAWLFVETLAGSIGNVTDSLYVDRAQLAPLRRVMHQGPAKVELTFRGDSVIGEIAAGPQQMPIRAQVQAPVFMEGAALNAALATLPATEGHSASLRTFDLMRGATTDELVRVGASERIAIGGTEFDAVRVELKPVAGGEAGTVLWIERAAPRRMLKAEGSLPAQAGGGKVTIELVP